MVSTRYCVIFRRLPEASCALGLEKLEAYCRDDDVIHFGDAHSIEIAVRGGYGKSCLCSERGSFLESGVIFIPAVNGAS